MGELTDEELASIEDEAVESWWHGPTAGQEPKTMFRVRRALYNAGAEDGAARERARIRGLTEALQRGVNSGPVTETNRRGIAAINAILNCVLAGIDATGEEEPAGAGGEGSNGS